MFLPVYPHFHAQQHNGNAVVLRLVLAR